MKTLRSLLSAIRHRVKIVARYPMAARRAAAILSCSLPEALCVDIGASYYPHEKWFFFLQSKKTKWISVEPNDKNLGYLKDWQWPCSVEKRVIGLSEKGGNQILFVTNVDSGSSLLEPVISASNHHRFADQSYFFPFKTREVQTESLAELLSTFKNELPILLKIDTQGTELSILRGAEAILCEEMVLGIELEATLLADPIMRGAGKFWEVCAFLEKYGFELLTLNPIQGLPRYGRLRRGERTYLNECDAVFAMRRDVVSTRPVEFRATLLAFYLTNSLREEAISLLDGDSELRGYLSNHGCDVVTLTKTINK